MEVEITKHLPILTEKNYYSDTHYLSSSRFKEYLKCPLRQLMIDLGFWNSQKSSEAFLVGNYVHSYFESRAAHEKFLQEHEKEIISTRGATKGQPKAAFKVADKMIASLEKESLFNRLYHGGSDDIVEKEKIITGFLGGIPFKCKIDSINLSGGYFVDLKTMESIQKETFSPTLKSYTKQAVYNVVEYQYNLQFYIYQQLLKQELGYELTPYMVVISKEPIPDKEIILIDDDVLESGEAIFLSNIDIVKQFLDSNAYPSGCGHCDYCLTHKKLEHAITLSDLVNK